MTKEEYTAYELAYARGVKGMEFLSTGECPGCEECKDNPADRHSGASCEFTNRSCEICWTGLGGRRYPSHFRNKEDEIVHIDICADCYYYFAYGQLDDMTMMDMEED